MLAAVTGAAGFIGTHLARELLEQGHDVCAIDRRLPLFGEPIVADLNDLDLVPLFGDLDVVFHLAAKPGVRTSWDEFDDYLADNLSALQRVLTAAEGIRVVFASSSSVYGEASGRAPLKETDELRSVSPYGVTKLAGEHLCRLHGDTVVLRYFTVYGPGQRPDMAFARFIDAALDGRPIEILGDGRQSRDFTYIDDVVRATLAAADCSPGTYNIAGDHATVADAVGSLERVLGKTVQIETASPARGDVRSTFADTTRARADLGFESTIDLAEGLRRQVEASFARGGVIPTPGSFIAHADEVVKPW